MHNNNMCLISVSYCGCNSTDEDMRPYVHKIQKEFDEEQNKNIEALIKDYVIYETKKIVDYSNEVVWKANISKVNMSRQNMLVFLFNILLMDKF